MDAVTYPETKVVEILNQYTIPLRVRTGPPIKHIDPELDWTPYLAMTDQEGGTIDTSVGFLTPDNLVSWILLGSGKLQFRQEQWHQAVNLFKIVTTDYPQSSHAPEALFFSAVARFRHSHEAPDLKAGYEELQKRYPDSVWAQKALPYRLL